MVRREGIESPTISVETMSYRRIDSKAPIPTGPLQHTVDNHGNRTHFYAFENFNDTFSGFHSISLLLLI